MENRVISQISRWCWLLLVLTLPITSQPLVAKYVRTGSVAPVAGVFLAILFIIWFVPFIFHKGKLPGQTIPFLFFILWAFIITAASVFRENPPYKDISVFASIVKSLLTLLIGMTFYLVIATYVRSERLIRITLQLVNWSGLFIIVWSLSQVAVTYIYGDYLRWMDVFQSFISTGVLVKGRASGFTLEPSWLAHQLNMLYLPLWLSCAFLRYSAHSFRIWKLHFEDLLLILGAVTLMASFSRVGLVAFMMMLALIFLLINVKVIRYIESRVFHPDQQKFRQKKILLRVVLIILLLVAYLGIALLVAQVFIELDPRMETLFTFSPDKTDPILRYANSLKFGERLIYWLAAWKIFGNFPWTGVGLGLAGFQIPLSIVPYGWSLTEVKSLLFHTGNLLNIKSIWFRLLAETGIIGFSLFISWLFVIFTTSLNQYLLHGRLYKVVGMTGILVLIGFLIEGFSVDSFALPYLWFSAGMVTAASTIMINIRTSHNKNES